MSPIKIIFIILFYSATKGDRTKKKFWLAHWSPTKMVAYYVADYVADWSPTGWGICLYPRKSKIEKRERKRKSKIEKGERK